MRGRAVAVGLAVAAAVSFLPAALQSQTAPPPPPAQVPTFRGGTIIVPLDVTVLDKSGKPVTDLTQGDFAVFENNTRQTINSFAADVMKPEPPPANAPPALVRGAAFDPLAPRTRRTFLFVLGYGRLQYPTKAVDATIHFIRERLLPQDLAGVIAFDRVTDLTTDHEQVAQVVERFRLRHEAIIQEIDDYFSFPGHLAEDIPPAIQAHIDEIFDPAATAERHPRSAVQMLLGVQEYTKNDAVSWAIPWNKDVTGMDVLKIQAGIEYLRFLDGDKHLVCLALGDEHLGIMRIGDAFRNRLEGLSMESTEEDVRLAARANDARVVLDLVHTGGIMVPLGDKGKAPPPMGLDRLFVVSSSENLAEFTGGLFTGVSYADAALARIDEATRFQYLLGYTPTNPALDEKYRTIRVTVNRKDVTVLFRHGYTAQSAAPPLDLREMLSTARLNSAGASDRKADIALAVKASIVRGLGPASQVLVEVTIDATRLSFMQPAMKHEGAIDIQIYCGDAKQQVVGERKERLEIAADADAYERVRADGIPYRVRIPVTGDVKFVKVAVYDYGADLLGTAVVTLK